MKEIYLYRKNLISDVLNNFIILFPCFACAMWSFLLFSMKGNTRTRYILALLAGVACAFFYLDACLVTPISNYRHAVVVNMFYIYIAPALFPIILIYFRKMEGKSFSSPATTLLFTPGLLVGSTAMVIYLTMGLKGSTEYLQAYDAAGGHPVGWDDDIYLLWDLVCVRLYRILIGLWMAVTTFAGIRFLVKNNFSPKSVNEFIFKGKTINTYLLICFSMSLILIAGIARGIIGREIIMNSAAIRWTLSIILTVNIFNCMYVGLRFDGGRVDFAHFRNPGLMDQELKAFREAQRRKAEAETGVLHNEETLTKLKDLFIEYMDVEKPYLNAELTLDDVSSALETNRTYLSSMLKNIMGVTFRRYINERRVQYAKEVLMAHPNQNLSDIAEISGFASDSQLIKKFSEIVGVSPRVWIKDEMRAGMIRK